MKSLEEIDSLMSVSCFWILGCNFKIFQINNLVLRSSQTKYAEAIIMFIFSIIPLLFYDEW